MGIRVVLVVALWAVGGCIIAEEGDDDDDDGDPSIPNIAYCNDVATWDSSYADLEQEVLVLVNAERGRGASCGSAGSFPSTGSLTMNSALRCSARVHSKDMIDRSFFDHENPDGEQPWDRMTRAGYDWLAAGENIAQGYPTASDVMTVWMGSAGHCSNIMSPMFDESGVGLYDGYTWTQNFGAR